MGYPMRASRFVLSAVCVGAVSVAVAQNASDSLPSAPSAVIQEEQKKAQPPPPVTTPAAPAPQTQEAHGAHQHSARSSFKSAKPSRTASRDDTSPNAHAGASS